MNKSSHDKSASTSKSVLKYFSLKGTEIETCICIGTDAEYLLKLCSYLYNHCYIVTADQTRLRLLYNQLLCDQNYIKHMHEH